MTCQDCRYFQKLDRPCSGEAGYCRIHPPVHVIATGRWSWPVVEGDEDWCSELLRIPLTEAQLQELEKKMWPARIVGVSP